MDNKKIEIDIVLLNAILDYLATRPYKEVFIIFNEISKIKNDKDIKS